MLPAGFFHLFFNVSRQLIARGNNFPLGHFDPHGIWVLSRSADLFTCKLDVKLRTPVLGICLKPVHGEGFFGFFQVRICCAQTQWQQVTVTQAVNGTHLGICPLRHHRCVVFVRFGFVQPLYGTHQSSDIGAIVGTYFGQAMKQQNATLRMGEKPHGSQPQWHFLQFGGTCRHAVGREHPCAQTWQVAVNAAFCWVKVLQ